MQDQDDRKHMFDDPKNVKRLLNGFYVVCAILFAADFVVHRHILHSWENLWGFYPLYGFVACVLLVLVATEMRKFLMRDENYYGDDYIVDEPAPDGDMRVVKTEHNSHTPFSHYKEDANVPNKADKEGEA